MLKIYCDGACSGNPGPGGWAFVIPELRTEQSGYEATTTNNRMEIKAVIEALNFVINNYYEWTGEDIEIVTDSQYVINTMTKGWQKKKNTDLWDELDAAMYSFRKIKWTWVKGHSSNEYNNRCDELAVAEYTSHKYKNTALVEIEITENEIETMSFELVYKPIHKYEVKNSTYIIYEGPRYVSEYILEKNGCEIVKVGTKTELIEYVKQRNVNN